jgi:hypothetical protein
MEPFSDLKIGKYVESLTTKLALRYTVEPPCDEKT